MLAQYTTYLYYYYRSRMQMHLRTSVFTLPSSRLDENLPLRSQFYSDHRVNFSTYRSCQSATLGPLTFCVYPLLLRPKIIGKRQQCGENATNGVNYEVLSANVKQPAGLHRANVKRPAGLHSANVKRPSGLHSANVKRPGG